MDLLILVSKHLPDFFLEVVVVVEHLPSKHLLTFLLIGNVILESWFELSYYLARKPGRYIPSFGVFVREPGIIVFHIRGDFGKEA